MPRSRSVFGTLLLTVGFALIAALAPAHARQPAKDGLPPRPGNYGDVNNFKTMQGIPKTDTEKAKAAFEAFAKYFADYISNPKVYSAPQEFRPDPPPPGTPYTVDALIDELNRHILVPEPGSRISGDQADYVRELGAALDTHLKGVIDRHGDRIARVNAARLLAAACRSGATAHYPTVTGLLANANTPPEIKYYLFQAAGNLLAAHDLFDLGTRRHSNKPKEIADLVVVLQDAILKPDGIMPPPKDAPAVKDYQDALTFIRRKAVWALGRCRLAEITVAVGGPSIYPGFTLARVAVSDPAITPPPSGTEVAEAVIGICNMSPPKSGAAAVPYAYAMADAVATGIVTFSTPRGANPTDKTTAWKVYAARINDAVKGWRALYDPIFNPSKPTNFAVHPSTQFLADLAAQADRLVLTPMEGTGVFNATALRDYRDSTLRANKNWTLAPFPDKPELVIPKR